MNKYGYFSGDRLEFVITRPDTPVPWVNYLSNGRYHALISNTGGGFSFYRSPKDSRITRWRYNSLPMDRPGRYIYIRNRKTGAYWSPTWQPTVTALDGYECRHGLYYSRFKTGYDNIQADLTFFVPEDDLEIWRIRLTNNSAIKKQLDIFAYTELCLGHALVDLINQPNDQHFNDVYFNKEHKILMASKRYWVTYSGPTVKQSNQAWDRYVFFASSLPVSHWDGSKNNFIGRWCSETNPQAVEQGYCSDSDITSGDAVAALQMPLDLKAGESVDFVIMLGVVPKPEAQTATPKLVNKYRDIKTVDQQFEALRSNWREYVNHVHIDTPDEDMNTFINVWNQYQTSVTFRFSRDASYYHGGLLFGRGFRDSCQDLMGPVIARPEWVKERILEMCTYQFADGSTYHLYYPLTGGGERTGHTDTPLWLPLAIMTYLKETGDFDLLQIDLPFQDRGSTPVLQHLYAAINYTLANLTDRKLAKFGPGDWNDTLDYLGREGRGESVWVTMFLCYILNETIDLCAHLRDLKMADHYRREYEMVADAVNTQCWDGTWYIRGTNDRGEEIGSSANEEGKIFLNTQSWAVISGIAREDRARLCMEAVKEHLETGKGPKILHPAYTKIDPDIGLATRCVSGKKENGAVFNHPVSWSIIAECILGRGDRAFEIYKKALPNNPAIDIDRYETEPYVYSEYVTSPDHPTYGQASHSWLTGSSVWMLRGALDYILGVQPTYTGLNIDPCLPAHFKKVKIERMYRGKKYDIVIENPKGLHRGVQNLTINGKSFTGNLIDLDDQKIKTEIEKAKHIRVAVSIG